MYAGYPGAYDAYGNPQQPAANAANPYQQAQQQHQQNYYLGQYENYAYGGMNAPIPPPPPPPPPPTDYFHTFPSKSTKPPAQGAYFQKPQAGGQYNGNAYEAAVYNYAAQNAQNPQKPWQKGRYGRQGTGDSKQYYCEVCKISCAGGITYKEHLEGQRHKKKEAAAKSGSASTSLPKNRLAYRCDLCDVTCSGNDTYTAHVKGRTHMKTVNLHRKLGKYVPEDIPTIIAPGADGPIETKAKPKWHQQPIPGTKKVIGINTINFVGGSKLNSTGQLEEKKKEVAAAVGSVGRAHIDVEDETLKAMMEAEEVQPVGEEHVTEERDATGKLVQFHCKLCDCKFSDPNAKEIHLKGRRHRLTYRQKIDPTLVVDAKPSTKRANEKMRKGAGPGPVDPSMVLGRIQWFAPPNPICFETNRNDLETFQEKHNTLHPGDEHIKHLHRVWREIEQTLMKVSRKIEEFMFPADLENKNRIVQDVQQIGSFAKGTFIKGEKLAEIVAILTLPPTPAMVQRIREAFPQVSTNLVVTEDPSSAVCLMISANDFPVVEYRVLLTWNDSKNNEGNDGLDSLDKLMCAHALSCLRVAKWYKLYCFPMNECQTAIRVFREMRIRLPVWAPIDDVKLEAIVYDVVSSSPNALNSSEIFKRTLEAISSGYLFSAILEDNCEPSRPNLLDTLTDQQKHDVTSCAQHFLRQIAFNQMHEVLGIERLKKKKIGEDQMDQMENSSENLKRPAENEKNEPDEEPATKKEKPEEELAEPEKPSEN